tara:strand:+ start:867 stop:1316 length:450 start_codon:yes stop_codon:yes gene_type:complete
MKTPILDSMIKVMESVAQEQRPFSMEDFFYNMPSDLSQVTHTCNTAACIIGYCVIDNDFRDKFLPYAHIKNSSVRDVCRDVCHMLVNEIGEELAGSIFECTAEDRAESLSKIDDHKNIATLIISEHVLSDNDCPLDALEYIKDVRSYLH